MKGSSQSDELVCNAPKYLFGGIYVDLFCYLIISIIVYGSYLIYCDVENLRAEALLKVTNDFKFYEYSSMYLAAIFFFLFIALHKLFVYVLSNTFHRMLRKNYLKEPQEIQSVYLYKVVTNFFKFCYFVVATVIGFSTLYNTEFFLDYRGGSQNFMNFYLKGIPYIYEMSDKEAISFYYNFNLGFVFFETYLLLIQQLQSDFLMMVIHHLATISLVVFSYTSNSTAIGSNILLILYLGDVFSTMLRTVIYLDVPDFVPACSSFAFLAVFSYTRLIVFSELIYTGYVYTPRRGIAEYCLYGLLTLILIMSLMWIIMITKKVIIYCKTGRIEEIYKVKVNISKIKSS